MAAQVLVTLAEAKAWLGITDGSEDVSLAKLITRASAAIANSLNRPTLVSAALTETYSGSGSSVQLLRTTPVTAVSSLTVDGIAVPITTSLTAAGCRFDDAKLVLNGGARFSRGINNVAVTYTGGYDPAAIPDDLVQAALLTIAALRGSQSVDPNIVSENVPGTYSASYHAGGAGSIPPAARSLLVPFKRVAPL